MNRIALAGACLVLSAVSAHAQYVDGLPAAASVSSSDLMPVIQGSTPVVGGGFLPGSGVARRATVGQILNFGSYYLPLVGGALTGPLALSVSPSVTAAGTTQGTATLLSTSLSVVTTAPASSGVRVPFIAGAEFKIFNRGANAILVYPPVGASIDGNTVNLGMSVAAGAHYALVCYSATACLSE